MKKVNCSNKTSGFTLVELLVAVSVLIILTGAAITVINPVAQRNKAEDGIRQSNLEKLALGIEAYANANGRYPPTAYIDSRYVPDPTNPDVPVFISNMPNDEPTAGTVYMYRSTSDLLYFGVWVRRASDTTKCFKYYSAWGKIQECTVTVGCTGTSVRTDTCN